MGEQGKRVMHSAGGGLRAACKPELEEDEEDTLYFILSFGLKKILL